MTKIERPPGPGCKRADIKLTYETIHSHSFEKEVTAHAPTGGYMQQPSCRISSSNCAVPCVKYLDLKENDTGSFTLKVRRHEYQ